MWDIQFNYLQLNAVQKSFLREMSRVKDGSRQFLPQWISAGAKVLERYNSELNAIEGNTLRQYYLAAATAEAAWVDFVKRFVNTPYQNFGTMVMLRCPPYGGSWEKAANNTAPVWYCRTRLCPWCSMRRAAVVVKRIEGSASMPAKGAKLTYAAFTTQVDDLTPASLNALDRPLTAATRALRQRYAHGIRRTIVQPRWASATRLEWDVGVAVLVPSPPKELPGSLTVGDTHLLGTQFSKGIKGLPAMAEKFCRPPTVLYSVPKVRTPTGFELDERVANYMTALKGRRLIVGFGELLKLDLNGRATKKKSIL